MLRSPIQNFYFVAFMVQASTTLLQLE